MCVKNSQSNTLKKMKNKKTINNFMKLFLFVTGLALMGFNAQAQWTLNEGFEGGSVPSEWTVFDIDNDGMQWRAYDYGGSAYAGNWVVMCDSYSANNNDWLITPQLSIQDGDIFTFYARAWFGTENLNVKLSTSGTEVANFNVTLEAITGLGTGWTEFTYDLSDYAGQDIHLAFHWVRDTYGIILDEIKVGQAPAMDAGAGSITAPWKYQMVDQPVIPAGTVKNFGNADMDATFQATFQIRDNSLALVYESSSTHTGLLAAGETAPVSFEEWTPTVTGLYQARLFTSLEGDSSQGNDTINMVFQVVEHQGTGGPDAQGYEWISSLVEGGPEYNWIDISETGTSAIMYNVNDFSGDDNFSEPIPIGFDFPFYGLAHAEYHVDINGELLFGSDNNWYKPFPDYGWENDGNPFGYHSPIPGYSEMPNLIAVFWDDLMADEGTGDIFFQSFGEAPNRYHVIQWNNLRFVAGNGGDPTLQFQVILHENGEIVMQYKNVDNGQSGSNVPHVFGQFATIGIQNQTADAGLAFLRPDVVNNQYNGPVPPGNLVQNEMAITFFAGTDNFVPQFSHQEVWNTFEQSMNLTATFTDVSGIASDTLYYNLGDEWQAMTHTSFEEPNIYHYALTDLPKGVTVAYYFVAHDQAGNRGEYRKEETEDYFFKVLPTADTRVLLASPGTRPGFSDYQSTEYNKYVMALDEAGVAYDFFNWAAYESYRFPEDYSIIIAYSSNAGSNQVHDTLSLALMTFMDMGTEANPKNLFMAADNMASAAHPMPNNSPLRKLYSAYFRGGYEVQPNPPIFGGGDGIGGPNNTGYSNGSIIGVAGSPIGSEGVELPVYSNSPDVIYPREAPEMYHGEINNPLIVPSTGFKFHAGPINGDAYSKGQASAIWLDNLIYKSFFISFDLSQFTNDSDINTMIAEALEWFGVDDPVNYVITATAEPQEGGLVEGAGTYPEGSTVDLVASPNAAYSFVEWTEDGEVVSTEMTYSFIASADRDLTAHFLLEEYVIDVTVDPAEGGTAEGAGTYTAGSTVSLLAIPNEGYEFVEWTEDGEVVSTETTYSFIAEADRSLSAQFQLQQFSIEVAVQPEEGGTISGAGTYAWGETAVLTATPADNFIFVNWEEDGVEISTDVEISFVVSADRSLVANFQSTVSTGEIPEAFNIRIYPNPASHLLTIELEQAMTHMEVYNLAGSLIARETIEGQLHLSLDVSGFIPGSYIIRFVSSRGEVSWQKLLIAR